MISGKFLRNFVESGAKKTANEAFAPSHLLASLDRSNAQRMENRGLRNRAAAAISNDVNRQRRAGRAQAALLAQAGTAKQGPPTSFASAISQASRRGKARYGIVNRGDKAIANQNLRDRLTFAKAGINRETQLQTMLQKVANIREGVNVGVSDANADIAASNAALGGSIIGAGAGLIASPEFRQWARNLGQPKSVSPSDMVAPPRVYNEANMPDGS